MHVSLAEGRRGEVQVRLGQDRAFVESLGQGEGESSSARAAGESPGYGRGAR